MLAATMILRTSFSNKSVSGCIADDMFYVLQTPTESNTSQAWVVPVAVVGAILGVILVIVIVLLIVKM